MLLNGSVSWRMREQQCFDLKEKGKKAASGSRHNHTTLLPLCTCPVAHYCFKGKNFASNNVDFQSGGSTQSTKVVPPTVGPFIEPKKSHLTHTKEPVPQCLCAAVFIVCEIINTRPIWKMSVFTWLSV